MPPPQFNPVLLTDLYELTMLQAYFEEHMREVAVFSLFVRRLPERRNYLMACGLEYSAFEGRTPDGNPFLADLRERGIRHLCVGGLATDYCVKHSVLDALSAGLRVTVLEDAIAGVERESSARAIVEMRERGAHVATSADVLISHG